MLTDFPENGTYLVAVVGAGSGIGRAAAECLAAKGARVGCLDRDLAAAAETARSIERKGGHALAVAADVTEERTLRPALDRIVEALGPVQGLVNCAGITGRTNVKAHEVDLADFDEVYRINLRGALTVSQAVLPSMLARNYGRILHIASIAGKEGNAGMAAYSATKAGLIGLVKSMAKDYAETGITINALAPAVIQTPLVEALPQATVDYMTAKIPMRRCGTLEEAAEMISWIVSPACSFTTGFTFDLSGGRATY
ncbi:MAG TPA: SDR family NAD(P)-dependent oxidoreductase [Alphaproteobacteria bacterium]|nr:SDR family NAD(P)-dependent oxidoreductase [Alphaproteobacteria bacterium]